MQKNFIRMSFFMLVSLLCFNTALAQRDMRISSSPNPVGSGARALGMGGAFIGVADDATAASWNPGGLVQLPTPEVSLVVNGFHRIEDNQFGNNPEACGSQSVTKENINYLSIVYPFNLLNRNMVISLNYQNLYDFTREWDFSLIFSEDLGFDAITTAKDIQYEQTGNLYAWGIAYSIQIVPEFTFGFTLNLWDHDLTGNQWETTTRSKSIITSAFSAPTSVYQESLDKYQFSGINANLGILFRPTKKLTIGGVCKLPFRADLEHEETSESFTNGIPQVNIPQDKKDEKLDMPMSYGIGLAYRFSDKLTLSADIYRTEWDKFIKSDSNGKETSVITGKPTDVSKTDPTHQLRCGMEYLFINPSSDYVIPFRAGIFYDPVPSEESPDDYYGLSLGSGIAVGQFVFDIAYQYRFGNDVGSSIISNYDFSQDVKEHTIYSSLIIHF